MAKVKITIKKPVIPFNKPIVIKPKDIKKEE